MSSSKILIVDDEPDLVLLLQEWLEEAGYEVSAATDAGQARPLFFQNRPDLTPNPPKDGLGDSP